MIALHPLCACARGKYRYVGTSLYIACGVNEAKNKSSSECEYTIAGQPFVDQTLADCCSNIPIRISALKEYLHDNCIAG